MEVHEITENKEINYQLANLTSDDLDRITELEKRLSESTNEDIALVAYKCTSQGNSIVS